MIELVHDRRRRIALSDKGDDFTKVVASWFSQDYFVSPEFFVVLDLVIVFDVVYHGFPAG